MSLELTFKSICETIKRQGNDDPKLIKGVDNLLGLALICSPVVLGPAAAALLPTLAVKNELIRIGKNVFDKLTKKKDEDYALRHETMCTAYGLLVFTSFFDALDSRLPEALRKEIALLDTEKAFLAKDAIGKTASKKQMAICEAHDAPISTYTFPFPHPTETLAEQCQRQSKLWKQMGKGFVDFVQQLAFWDNADEKKRASLLLGLEKIDEEAAKLFEAQYFELARRFEDFAVWANLQAHKSTGTLIEELSDYVKYHAKLSTASQDTIDVGFAKLRETVLSIPDTLRIRQATEIADSLHRYYQARINDPIIKEDNEVGDEDKPRLCFPKVSDAFVPQEFRVLRQAGNYRRLEDESTWSKLPRRNDLGAFLLSFLSSPYSTDAPLLILGHPGSGKSLLTTILSAQLMSKQFTAIRVPLREVNADADVVTQIEDAIRRITGVSVDSWIKLSALFKNCPPIVILDGYDELLQASGQVFASYIKDAQRFQEREAEQGRPLRIIITSRVTLIDKAAVPDGATIVRLLEFNHHQRECWCAIWNKANAAYFRDKGIENFSLPSEEERGAEKILNLAEQPLLLLMLALYDSQKNQLRGSKELDRTKLYDSLLRRFVIRERGKEKNFYDAKGKERDKALSVEMQRLGVAALGMYNRRKVHILSPELDDDLSFFKLEREVTAKLGKALSQADLLLGSFFFVHKSKAQHSSGAQDTHEETAAFEFLHNTFGEFLTADFVIRRAVAQVQTLRAAESSEALQSMIDKMMGTADGFERDWFASLVYTPLFTRPVIMEMIREWAQHVLRDNNLSEDDFVETLEKIVLNQIKRMLSKREMPQIMRKETAQEGYRVPFGDHPLVGHIAIYSINLILLRLITGKRPFVFDEAEVASHDDGTRPWDRLMHIWRSWFALSNLNGLTTVMLAERAESKIRIIAKSSFKAIESRSRLHEFHNVAVSLGDSISAGITGLYLFDSSRDSASLLNSIERYLSSEGFSVGPPLTIARLFALGRHFPDSPDEFVSYGIDAMRQVLQSGNPDQLWNVCLIIVRILEDQIHARLLIGRHAGILLKIFRDIFPPGDVVDIAMRAPGAARIIFDLGEQLHDVAWLNGFSDRFLQIALHETPRLMLESDAAAWTNWIRLLREVGRVTGLSPLMHRRFYDELLERMFSTHHLLELSERKPEAALAYGQILRELGSRVHFERLIEQNGGPDFFDRMLHPRHLLELSERNAEAAVAYLQILRELGGRYFERFMEQNMGPEFFDRMFNPRHLLELSERNAEAAVSYLQILRELGGRYFKLFMEQNMGPKFLGHMFNPRHLLELSEHRPEAAMAYLKIMRELGGRYFERFMEQNMGPEFFDHMFNPRHLLELSERNPEAAVAYLQILRQLSGRYFERFMEQNMGPEFFDHMFNPRNFFELSERNPEAAVLYLQILRQLGGRYFERFMEQNMGPEFFDRMFHPRHLLELSQRNPEAATTYLQILRELDGGRYFERFMEQNMGPEFFDRMFHPRHFLELSEHRIQELRFWLACARLFESKRFNQRIVAQIVTGLRDQTGTKRLLSSLPITSLADLRWLSEQTKAPQLGSLIAELV
jgi:hypothetical protein